MATALFQAILAKAAELQARSFSPISPSRLQQVASANDNCADFVAQNCDLQG
jgi:hypothetical protein